MSIAIFTTLLQPLQAGLNRITHALPQDTFTHDCSPGRRCTFSHRCDPRCAAGGERAGQPHKGTCPFKNFA